MTKIAELPMRLEPKREGLDLELPKREALPGMLALGKSFVVGVNSIAFALRNLPEVDQFTLQQYGSGNIDKLPLRLERRLQELGRNALADMGSEAAYQLSLTLLPQHTSKVMKVALTQSAKLLANIALSKHLDTNRVISSNSFTLGDLTSAINEGARLSGLSPFPKNLLGALGTTEIRWEVNERREHKIGVRFKIKF